jgi:hypothetical protein
LTLTDLKAEELEIELRIVYGDEALRISAMKKWRTPFLQGRTELGDDPRSGRLTNSDLTQMIIELIQEGPFLSYKILCRHLRVSKETCLRILHEKLGLIKFYLR